MANPAPTPKVVSEVDDSPDDLSNIGNEPVISPQRTPPVSGVDEFEILELGDDGQPIGGGQEAPLTEDTAGQRPVIGQDGQPATSKNAQRRQQQKDKARRNLQELSRVNEENSELRAKVDFLMGRMGGHVEPRLAELDRTVVAEQKTQIDQQLARADQDYEAARKAMAQAMSDQDHSALEAAMTHRDEAILRRGELKAKKESLEALTTQAAQRQTQQRQPQQNFQPQQQRPMIRNQQAAQQMIDEIIGDVSWFDRSPQTTDNDSRVMQAIDAGVLNDGYDPNTRAYWEELEARASRFLPDRFPPVDDAEVDDPPKPVARQQARAQQRTNVTPLRRGPAVAGGADRPARPSANQVVITPDRKAALIEIGALNANGTPNDPAKLKRYLAQYQKYDRENSVAR